MMRIFAVVFAVAGLGLSLSGCAGGGNGSPAGATSTNFSVPSNAIVINGVAIDGAQFLSPNPGSIPSAQLVVWHDAGPLNTE